MNSALIVEPDPRLRRSLTLLLGSRGWQVDAVEHLTEAIGLLAGPPRQVVYINETTDDDSGYLLLFAIRRHPRWRLARVVMGGIGDCARHSGYAAELGADGYLSQPFTATQALAKLGCDTLGALLFFPACVRCVGNFSRSVGQFQWKARTEWVHDAAAANDARRTPFL